MEENFSNNSNIYLENRKKINISGVLSVDMFDEETISLETELGKLIIKGIGLHILSYNVEIKDLSAEGKINAVIYTAEEKNEGFFARLFK